MYTFPEPDEGRVQGARAEGLLRHPLQRGGEAGAGSSSIGEYTFADTAYAVGYALAKAEHERASAGRSMTNAS